MDATEYVGRRATRALGLLPAALVVTAAVAAVAGLVALWRLTTPMTGLEGANAGGSLWQRVTMAIAAGYDVAPLAWGSVALVAVALLARTPVLPVPTPGERVRRAAVVLAGTIAALSLVAVVLVVVWAVLTRGEVTFSVEVPGDQDAGRVTTQVGTYLTDPWVALLHVVPALVAAVLAGGALAVLLHPAPSTATAGATTAPTEASSRRPADDDARPGTGTQVPPVASVATDPPDAVPTDALAADSVPAGEEAPVVADPSVFARDAVGSGRTGRGSGGAARFARSVAATPHVPNGTSRRPAPRSTDLLEGWTMGPGTTSDVAYRRPGPASDPWPRGSSDRTDTEHGADDAPGPGAQDQVTGNGQDGAPGPDGQGPDAVATRDPYRRPGA